jgi:ribosomal protein L11 methyltransferase
VIETPGPLLEISVAVDGEAAEAVCELFERYGGGAVVEIRVADFSGSPGHTAPSQSAPSHTAPSQSAPSQTAPSQTAWVRTYLPVDDIEARRRVEVGLWYLSRLYPVPEPLLRELAEANWADAWKEHFTPLQIGERFWVIPAWIDPATVPAAAGGLVIQLDPGMAFGTGLHPTTQLCLAALEARVRPGDTVLDVGTGSGILAIGAARLGAARVVGVDIDPRALAIAATNAALNGVALEIRSGRLEDAGEALFDLVVANILAGTIIEMAPALAARVRPGGLLIVSGILAEQAEAVCAGLAAAGLAPVGETASGDWVALTARQPGR